MPARIIAIAVAAALAIFGLSRVRKHRKTRYTAEAMPESNGVMPAGEQQHHHHHHLVSTH
jgi:hypothetical protein